MSPTKKARGTKTTSVSHKAWKKDYYFNCQTWLMLKNSIYYLMLLCISSKCILTEEWLDIPVMMKFAHFLASHVLVHLDLFLRIIILFGWKYFSEQPKQSLICGQSDCWPLNSASFVCVLVFFSKGRDHVTDSAAQYTLNTFSTVSETVCNDTLVTWPHQWAASSYLQIKTFINQISQENQSHWRWKVML